MNISIVKHNGMHVCLLEDMSCIYLVGVECAQVQISHAFRKKYLKKEKFNILIFSQIFFFHYKTPKVAFIITCMYLSLIMHIQNYKMHGVLISNYIFWNVTCFLGQDIKFLNGILSFLLCFNFGFILAKTCHTPRLVNRYATKRWN